MPSNEESRIKVAVIYGGKSSEHNVSCISAGAIMDHLDPARYEVYPVGITRDGTWTVGETDTERLRTVDRVMPEVELKEKLSLSLDPDFRGKLTYTDGTVYADVDVIFPVLHGRFGEDGTIQGAFELSGIPYVGTGVLSSAAGMDKEFTKKLLQIAGIPVSNGVVLRAGEELTEEDKESLGLPVFVKPAQGGSSIGVTRVDDWANFEQALAEARTEDSKVLVESATIGAEVECGVMQLPSGELLASLPAQLVDIDEGAEGFYGFDTKYLDDVVSAIIPAPIGDEAIKEIQDMSIEAFKALNGEGLARVDFFYTDHGPVINEINTMPGFTPISMYPQVFAKSGISYPELLDSLIQRALVAHSNKN